MRGEKQILLSETKTDRSKCQTNSRWEPKNILTASNMDAPKTTQGNPDINETSKKIKNNPSHPTSQKEKKSKTNFIVIKQANRIMRCAVV